MRTLALSIATTAILACGSGGATNDASVGDFTRGQACDNMAIADCAYRIRCDSTYSAADEQFCRDAYTYGCCEEARTCDEASTVRVSDLQRCIDDSQIVGCDIMSPRPSCVAICDQGITAWGATLCSSQCFDNCPDAGPIGITDAAP